ncbi:MAG: SMC-Scp complex subunit ScpB, partial [Deltaproteobacteria bacterium]|nr:SMC-Scp complex subunit ScpB [Deltaproteobacteria bacterium]
MIHDNNKLKHIIEALVLTSTSPLPISKLKKILEEKHQMTQQYLTSLINEIKKECEETRGIVLVEVAGGLQFRTKPHLLEWLKKLDEFSPIKMTRALVETMAIIAYKQPLTKAEVEDIRGVDSSYAVKSLLEGNFIKISGRKEDVGRPLLYTTTDHFLEFFSLNSLRDLPSLKEFAEIQVTKFNFTNQLKNLKNQ